MWILPAWLCYQTIWRGTQIPFLFHSRNHIVLVWPLCVPACASFQCYCLSPADHFFESSLMACDWYNVVVVTVEDFFDYFRRGSPYLMSASNPVTLWSCHSTKLGLIPFLSSRLCSCSRLYFSNFIFSLEKASFYSFTTIMYFLQRHWLFLHWWCYLMMFHILSSLNYCISPTSVSQLEIESEQLEDIQVLLSWMSVPNSLSCMWNAEPYATSLTIGPSNLILSASGIFFGNGTAEFTLCIFCFNLSTDSRSNSCYFDGLGLNSVG